MRWRRVLFLVMVLMLAACSGQNTASAPTGFGQPVPNQVNPSQGNNAQGLNSPTQAMQVILVPSEVVVGPNRFAIGLIDPLHGMVRDASVHLRYFDLSNPSQPVPESEADATRLETADHSSAIYAQEREFKRAGQWGVEVQAHLSNGLSLVKRIGFQVVASSPTLKIGDKVPALSTRTAAEVGNDLHKLSSATNPNPAFYRLSLAQALTNGKPTLLLFATPAFCQSRLCGPSYDVLTSLQQRYGDRFNYVHVEVYTGLPNPAANNWQLDPAMTAFGLQSEPWLYVINKGVVTYRVEGLFTADEVAQQIKPLAGPS